MSYNPERPYDNDVTKVAEPVGTGPDSTYKVISQTTNLSHEIF